ncbi:MAG: acetate--CoA ligase family protein, partial [Rhizobiales bacterium]|nr:acetate--CoA ligase family protein [Hyphomicrobiales bacterium]
NPKRDEIGGHKCYAAIEDLPEAPDAVFLAIPVDAAIDAIARLKAIGAGGIVCYTAGFGEVGDDGAEAALIEAAGDMALVGPNCYGLINYLDQIALWPFAHGGGCDGYGAAIVTQSGMLSSDLTMNQRSVPLAYMISAGNQSVLHLEDFIDVLAERDEVRAIGLHIEGLRNVPQFAEVALKAANRGVPIVALKSGTSQVGAQLTISHTGSLSGTDELYQALFDRFGIIRVGSPAQMLETLKFICVAGVPKGRRVAGFTCSGGGATMLADHGERLGLEFPQPNSDTAEKLRAALPHTATVSNPLDYTTPIWGCPDKVKPVFTAMFDDAYDAAALVQDYPLAELNADKQSYLNDAGSFIAATGGAGLPAAVISTLPENIDADTRDMLCAAGVAPMQGLPEALTAIGSAAWFGERCRQISERPPRLPRTVTLAGDPRFIDEWQAKQHLKKIGLNVPDARLVGGAEAGKAALAIGFPVALKMISDRLAHKTEAGAVALNLADAGEVAAAAKEMVRRVAQYDAAAVTDQFIVEAMAGKPVAELLVDVRHDEQFGLAMTIASGGVLVEVVGDAVTLLLPASAHEIDEALGRLKVDRLLNGVRGQSGIDRTMLVEALVALAAYAGDNAGRIAEIEINPLFVLADRVVAVDALMSVVID